MNDSKTIPEILEMIANEMCDNYCKYPTMYSSEEWGELLERDNLPCNKCPLLLFI